MCQVIEDIEALLKQWGNWQRASSGTAIPKTSVCMRYAPRGGQGAGLTIVRDPVSETLDRIICDMGQHFGGHYRRMVVSIYVHNAPLSVVAQDQRVSLSTLNKRLIGARAWLHAMATAHKLFA